ncbi:hypothetical protein ACNVED_04795 [Legionella sp. D16C41]|uniref:hypothetical protein n=1 Tax=Legionella sp. D16C41 TaxID=3402688 RepID=UPI003AF636B4
MDLPRFVFACFVIFTSLYSLSIYSQSLDNSPLSKLAGNKSPDFGIAFIHGNNDHRSDAEGIYWKKEFINTLTSVLPKPENYFVVACDYSHYMWHEDAAGCTATQLLSFIKNNHISKLKIYTHSEGANVIRWILSNPTYDPRYLQLSKRVAEVIALSPSSGGTPLAEEVVEGNLFEASVSWLIGYLNDGVRQQRVLDMAIYNNELLFGSLGRPSLSVPFRVIIGTDVTASPLNGASYCNGYRYNAGLKVTKLYLDKCADGFIECISQRSVGTVWFYDIQKTEHNNALSHNQSRHNCFGLDMILSQDLANGVA